MALPFQLIVRPNFAVKKNMNMKRGTNDQNNILGKSRDDPCLVVELGKSKRNGRNISYSLAARSRKLQHNRGHAAPSLLSKLIGVGPFLHDLPELPELDNLFAPQGPILEAQQKAAQLFGSSETWFLVGVQLVEYKQLSCRLAPRGNINSSQEFTFICYICNGIIRSIAKVYNSKLRF